VLACVVLDGFNLGVGSLFAAEHGDDECDVMVNSPPVEPLFLRISVHGCLTF